MYKRLYTSAGEALQGQPWSAYPRPQMKREGWLNLNGTWEFAVSQSAMLPANYDKSIRVPFPPESLLSGIGIHFPEGSFLFYRKKLTLPEEDRRGRVLLHIGAADQITEVYVNQKLVGTPHIGGYDPMTFDITEVLEEENELVISCWDSLYQKYLPYGKQRIRRGGMWYTPVSGIWQTVWLEFVPENYIRKLDIRTGAAGAVIDTGSEEHQGTVTVETPEGSVVLPLKNGKAQFSTENPRMWSPEDPYLYRFTVETGEDRVESYFALRTLEVKTVDGYARLCLNGKPYFFHGLLDQGYWSDGIYTPATPECYEEDILAMKKLGFNMLRKHIKVEPEQFYYDCDRLGMVVFQDMVNNGDYRYIRDTVLPTIGMQVVPDKYLHPNKKVRRYFYDGMKTTVRQLKNHPCICYWTIFNEGWGQHDADRAYGVLKKLDSSRFIDSTSGWFRRKETDVDSRHVYFKPLRILKAGKKPLVLSEFGGFSCKIKDHSFNQEKTYGYGKFESTDAFMDALEALYTDQVAPLVAQGLCAAVYTQVSDVEDETNGLVTYDRKVTKVDEKRMRKIAELLKI